MTLGVVMQMTWVGAPTIYYGDEAGVCGFTDPDSRRTYPWGHEDKEMIAFHKDIIRIHKENKEIRKGSIKNIASDYNFLAYARFNRQEQSLILINNNSYPIEREIPVWEAGVPKKGKMITLMQTTEEGYTLEGEEYEVNMGKIRVNLPKISSTILKFRRED